LQALLLSGAPRTTVRRAPRAGRATHALQTVAVIQSLRRARRAADTAQVDLGRAGAMGLRARVLCVVRRPAELLQRALLRPTRRRPDGRVLARRLSHDREGHPALSRRLLASPADGRRAGAAAARVRARISADGRREDVEVA